MEKSETFRTFILGLLLSLTIWPSLSFCSEEETQLPSGIGPGNAVEETKESDGFRLSEKAVSTLGIKTAVIAEGPKFRVPVTSVVYSRDDVGIYRLRNGWYKLAAISSFTKSGQQAIIETSELVAGDQIVVSGVGLLRVADLNLTAGPDSNDSD